MRKNAQDYLFSQIASAVEVTQGAARSPNYWMSVEDAARFKAKLEWLLTEAFGRSIVILTDTPTPSRFYDLLVDGEKYRISAEFALIDVEGPDGDLSSDLFDFLTGKFYRITLDNLEGYDDVYQEFIDNHRFPG